MRSARPRFSDFDRQCMARALSLAARGLGYVEPNPLVGCVIVRGTRILAEGYHHRFGEPHAEVDALTRCRSKPTGATAYVTLEPCSHQGKTPPCANALIDARIARVVVPTSDPFPAVAGRGCGGFGRPVSGWTSGFVAMRPAALTPRFSSGFSPRNPT